MTNPTNPSARRLGRVLVNHLGFTCGSTKQVMVREGEGADFEVQDMARIATTPMGAPEQYKAVMTGRLRRVESPFGPYGVGDFSALTAPGIYRVTLPATGEHSYQFAVTDGVCGWLPGLFLNFVRAWRSGPFENAWRGPTHLDDAKRTDNGEPADAVGGWYDAGDLRKWMVHSNLPALALMDAHGRIPWAYAEWERVDKGWSPWLLEARWGLDFMLKMQDPESGMFFEDVGGGGNSRKRPGMSWWYENHAGCYADNADNRFTDNKAGSGDERPLRIQYNPVVQFTSVTILARAAQAYDELDTGRAWRCAEAAERGWRLGLNPEPKYLESADIPYGQWTAVRSWRTLAALALHRCGRLPWEDVAAAARELLENFDAKLGFWRNTTGGSEPYRGILHSAQPLIALVEIARAKADPSLRDQITGALRRCLEAYVYPMSNLSPFRIMPFGAYREAVSEGDLYRPWRDGYRYRFLMPENHPQKINHGLAGHWTSWAHALALVGALLEEPRCTELAWRQLHWLLGGNPFNSSLVSGVGYNNPMPHSRFLGAHPGGFCTGFNGSADDQPQLDLEGDAQWNTTEYWMTPLSNTLMALAVLNPPSDDPSRKLGRLAMGPKG
jgi:glycosyl hydrolase family 9